MLALADAGVIAILDMEFIASDQGGHARKVDVAELSSTAGADLSSWASC